MRRLVAFLLSIMMFINIIPVQAFAEDTATTGTDEEITTVVTDDNKCGENVYWKYESATATITIYGSGPMYDYELDKSTQRTNSPWDRLINSNVVIEEGITHIGNYSFSGFMIGEIVIPDSVETIGGRAFYNCAYLTDIYLGDGVKNMSGRFEDCISVENVHISSLESWLDESKNLYLDIVDYNEVVTFNLCINGEKLTDIVIPNSVTKIRPNAFKNQAITSVSIHDKVTEIGDYAFGHSHGEGYGGVLNPVLENIVIPDSVVTIGNGAFYGNHKLKSITVSKNLETIGGGAFSGCSNLTAIDIPDTVKVVNGNAFEGCLGITSINIPESLEYIGDNAFSGTSTVFISVVLPQSVKHLGATPFGIAIEEMILSENLEILDNNAFSGCTNLKSITLPENVNIIGDYAFDGCTALISINIPDSVESIGDGAFRNCTSLSTISLPDSVSSLGSHAFYSSGIVNIELPANLTEIKAYTFYECNFTSIDIPDTVVKIDSYAFYGCDQIGTMELPSNLQYVGNHAFKNCYKMATGELPETITHIGDHGFDDCRVMVITKLPEGLTALNQYVFRGCHAFTEITIPASVKTLKGAFYCCFGLKDIYFEGDAPSIDYNSFGGVTGTCYYPKGNTTYTSAVTGSGYGGTLNWVEMNADSSNYCGENITWELTDDGVLKLTGSGAMYDYDGTKAVYAPWYSQKSKIKSVEVSAGITHLGQDAFSACNSLTTVSIPETVVSAGINVFEYCVSLKSIVLPDSLTYIPSGMFYGCTNLIDVDFPKYITIIGGSAFSDCTQLGSVVLPEGLVSIGDYAFYGCGYNDDGYNGTGYNFTSVTLPSTVKSIGKGAFCWCNSLTSINIPYGVETIGAYAFQWAGIGSITIPSTVKSIGTGTFQWCRRLKTVYFYGDAPEFGSDMFGLKSGQKTTAYYPGANETWTDELVTSMDNYYVDFIPWDAVDEPGAGGGAGGNEGDDSQTGGGNQGSGTDDDNPSGNNPGGGNGNQGGNPSGEGSGSGGESGEGSGGTSDTFTVSVSQSVGGVISANITTAEKGQLVTITVTPDQCYELVKLYVNGEEISDLTFEISSDSTVSAEFIEKHTEVIDSAVLQTCTQTGLTEGSHCSACNKIFVSQKIVDSLGHISVQKEENYTEATCYSEGYYDIVTYCAREECQETLDRRTSVLPKTDHNFEIFTSEITAATCTQTGGYTVTKTCREGMCGHTEAETVIIDMLGHQYMGTTCKECGTVHPEINRYNGKVISIFGDSISTFAGYIPTDDGFNLEHLARYPQDDLLTDANETWWMQIINDFDAKLGINDSWRGATVSGAASVTSGVSGEKSSFANIQRIKNLGSNGTPDIILFYGGTNDIAHVSKVGTFETTMAPENVDLDTLKWDNLADGYVNTLLRLKYYYPETKIIAMLPAYTVSYYSDEKLMKANDVLSRICKYYDVEYVDLVESGLTTADLPDGIHPDANGMDYITYAVEKALLKNATTEPGENIVHSITHKLTNVTATQGYYKGVSAGKPFEETFISEDEITVLVEMDGKDITDECVTGNKIRIENVTGDIVITAKAMFSLDGHLKELPEKICAGLNLWQVLEHDEYYFISDNIWGIHSSGNVYSVTIPVSSNDKIYATSFGKAGENGNASVNGIRVAFFNDYGVLKNISADEIYNEFDTNGYITVPDAATAVCIPMWNNSDANELYILTEEHNYLPQIIEPDCAEKGCILYTCSVCGHTYTENGENAIGHIPVTREDNRIEATCYAEGYYDIVTYCSRPECQEILNRERVTLPKTDHEFEISTSEITPATCYKTGGYTITKICKEGLCGYSETETVIIEKTEHTYTDSDRMTVMETPSTCISKGGRTTVLKCSVEQCGAIIDGSEKTEELPLADHSYGEEKIEVVQPDCTEDGYKIVTRVCTVAGCGYEFVIKETPAELKTKGHKTTGAFVPAKNSTCTENGWEEEHYICPDCGKIVDSNGNELTLTIIPAKNHIGTRTRFAKENIIPATCETSGSYDYVEYCDECSENYIISCNTVTEDALGHGWSSEITQEPKCESPGVKTFTCIRGCTKTEQIDPTGHINLNDAVKENIVSARCEADGSYDMVVRCADCNKVVSTEHFIIDARQHNYVGYITVKPICKEDGVKTFTCQYDDCESYYTEPVEKLGHSYSDVVTVPTCITDGYTTYTCTSCGDSYTDNETEATGHSYQGEITIQPTCTEAGVKTFTCDCGDSYTETVKASGHTEEIISATEPDCINTGLTSGAKCSVCNTVLKEQEIIKELGHDWTEWIEIEVASCTENGIEKRTCQRCSIGVETRPVTSTGHNIVVNEIVEPTCESSGYTKLVCTNKDCEYFEIVDEIEGGHKYESKTVVPDCDSEGYTRYTCTRCGEWYDDNFVEALVHTAGEVVVENEVAAECEKPGSYDEVVYCTVCGEEISRNTIPVEALGHTAGEVVVENEVAADCVNGGSYDEVVYCTVCGEEISRNTIPVEALGHTAGEVVVENEVAADCVNGGSYDEVFYCTVCG
ncbi:MAG: leucine-rich repeat protein [Oscillospiraceae bacterium]|nr:leucine-rich repeat protein [Oscillospiraceae bacterium]